MSSNAAPLDFSTFLSRDYRPANVTFLNTKGSSYESGERKVKKATTARTNGPSKVPATDGEYNNNGNNRRASDEEASRLVMKLVARTQTYARHAQDGEMGYKAPELKEFEKYMPKAPTKQRKAPDYIPSYLHEVELGDWEDQIRWDGYEETTEHKEQGDTTTADEPDVNTGAQLLQQRRNPFLEDGSWEKMISWDGTKEDTMEKSKKVPLILELGVAGESIARQLLPVRRHTPFVQSSAFQRKLERDWAAPVRSTADASKGSLHPNKDEKEAIYEARQRKRAQMEKDKTNRVTQALGTLGLGGGRGRTITSSLMGPGGTERTGRPSRHMGTASIHDTEYVEQLPLVSNHNLAKPNLSKVELRQYHRPKLPMSVVRKEIPWQFQIRVSHGSKKADSSSNSASYQSMMGTHAGALSQERIRTEADLSPGEGMLVLFEYCEERPPIQLTTGMASRIINYFRGDRSRCPISAGGGDRPTRRKRGTEAGADNKGATSSAKTERPSLLMGPNHALHTSVVDWIGKLPKKQSREDRGDHSSVNILPEGVTEILHPKMHGPFIGEIEEGTIQTGLISNLFAAPMFRHEPEETDFLMILRKKIPCPPRAGGPTQSLGVVLRPLPANIFVVGQTEPRHRVHAPNTKGEKDFAALYFSYQIAKALAKTENKEGRGLKFDEISQSFLSNQAFQGGGGALRQRLKQVAVYDKNTGIWTCKQIGFEDYPGVESLGRKFTPESVAGYETGSSASRRLCDLGITELFSASHTVASVGVAMVYLAGQVNATRELSRKMKKWLEACKTNRLKLSQIKFYEKAAAELDALWKQQRIIYEVAQFIYEELQLTPWNLTGEFIDVHKNAAGTGMMKLTGLGDPSGQGAGFSFLREIDSKPSKSFGAAAGVNAQVSKITGTQNDLRKLSMKQMAAILRSYGLAQKQIDTLKRWDRVHVIRDLSTKAASDGIGDGLERFARGEKMKLTDQKEMYRKRVQVIWERQRAVLSTDAPIGTAGVDTGNGDVAATQGSAIEEKKKESDREDSDSDSDDDDFAADFEEDIMDARQTNQIVAAHVRGEDGNLDKQRTADLDKEARDLAAFKRQREEERAAKEGLLAVKTGPAGAPAVSMIGRKVIRRRITKTYPDGRQTVTFKFIVVPDDVGQILVKKEQSEEDEDRKSRAIKHERGPDEKPLGHAFYEEEDDFDDSPKSRGHVHRKQRISNGSRKKGGTPVAKAPPRIKNKIHMGKLKTKVSKEQRMKKRKREEEEAELYVATAKRMGTSNRRERGSVRERMPHVILADKMEVIRAAVEKRPNSGAFHKPVNRRQIPHYYESISNPIDLQTIREKNTKFEYRTAQSFLRDFELMRDNAIKFNGQASTLGMEAIAIYDFVKEQVEVNQDEFDGLEKAVVEQLTRPKKQKRQGESKSKSSSPMSSGMSENFVLDGVSMNFGDLQQFEDIGSDDSGDDDSYSGAYNDL